MNTDAQFRAGMNSQFLQTRSSFWNRAPVIALAAAVALLVAGLILAAMNERDYSAQKIDEATGNARFLALIVTAALDSDDRATAEKYLDALRSNPEAEAAAIYDSHGALFASYSRAGAPALPAAPPRAGASFAGNRLILAMPVTQAGTRLGTVFLDIVTEPLWRRLQRNAMRADVGWSGPARRYAALFRELVRV